MYLTALALVWIAVSGLVSSGVGRLIEYMAREDDYDMTTFPSTLIKEPTQ